MKALKGIEPVGCDRPLDAVLADVMARFDALAVRPGAIPHDVLVEAERLTRLRREELFRLYSEHCGPTPSERAYEMPLVLVALYFAYGANLKRLYERLQDINYPGLPDNYVRFWRAFDRVPEGVKDYLKLGSTKLLERFPFIVWYVHELNKVWHLDATTLKLSTPKKDSRRSKTGRRETTAWSLNVWEGSTRYLLATVVIDHAPTADDVIALLASAMRWRPEGPDGVYVGGVPTTVLTDNGKENIASSVDRYLATVGSEHRLTRRYMKQLNGKAERNGQAFTAMLTSGLPNSTRSPERYNRSGAMHVDLERSVSVATLNDEAQKLRHQWNWERMHRGIKDVPGLAWRGKDDHVYSAAIDVLARYFPPGRRNGGSVTYDKGRIEYGGNVYVALPGPNSSSAKRKLIVRHPVDDDSVLWGYYETGNRKGDLMGRFVQVNNTTPADAEAIDQYRIKTTTLCEDLAAFAAVLQAAETDLDPLDTAIKLYGHEVLNQRDYGWLREELDGHSDLLTRKPRSTSPAEVTLDKQRAKRSKKAASKVDEPEIVEMHQLSIFDGSADQVPLD